jgi:hypothetical protein
MDEIALCRDRLCRAGWSVADSQYADLWQVNGRHGENALYMRGEQTQREAWLLACQRAQELGLLAPAREGPGANEAAWLDSQNADWMLDRLGVGPAQRPPRRALLSRPASPVSLRKLRLLACACCRRAWGLLLAEKSRRAVEVAERAAEGDAAGRRGRPAAEREAWEGHDETAKALSFQEGYYPGTLATWAALDVVCSDRIFLVREALFHAKQAVALAAVKGPQTFPCPFDSPEVRREDGEQARLLLDILGNPFRPLAVPPACRTPTVVHLARAAYEERELPSGHLDPARLAVLADALEETGADRALLDHLRSPGPHVRGCHVVDLIRDRD